MNDRFLPLTRRGLRCFRSGIGLAALCMLTGGIQQYVTLLSPGAGLSLRWLQPVVASMSVVASGLMLVGVLFMTACPAEAGVARWGIGILALSALASLWPVVVYAADLPFGALTGPLGNAGIGLTAIQTVLLAGMLGALCRWMASVERRAAACCQVDLLTGDHLPYHSRTPLAHPHVHPRAPITRRSRSVNAPCLCLRAAFFFTIDN